MTKLKPLTPIDEQLRIFKLQFALYDELKQWRELNPQPPYAHRYNGKGDWDLWFNASRAMREQLTARGWEGYEWTWDDDWDGKLITRVYHLDRNGFEIQRFWRKMKIDMRIPKMSRMEIMAQINFSVGDDWVGVNFKRSGMSLWWEGGGPWKNYRP